MTRHPYPAHDSTMGYTLVNTDDQADDHETSWRRLVWLESLGDLVGVEWTDYLHDLIGQWAGGQVIGVCFDCGEEGGNHSADCFTFEPTIWDAA